MVLAASWLGWVMGCCHVYKANESFRHGLEGVWSLGTGKGAVVGGVVPMSGTDCPVVGGMRAGAFEACGVFWPILVLRLLNVTTEHPSCVLPSSVITAPETPFPCLHLLWFLDVFLLGLYLKMFNRHILEKGLGCKHQVGMPRLGEESRILFLFLGWKTWVV